MKKLNLSIRSLFVLCLAAVTVAANAQQVSQEEAANIALQFLKGNGSQNSRLKKATPEALKLVYTEPSAKDKSANLYIYNMEGGGFAIVSADARTGSQILGYSFDNNFSAKGMPDNVKYWLGEYSRQIDFIKAHQPEVSESKRRERLKKDSGPIPASPTVAPLLSTTWGQDAPYNGMTPTIPATDGEHTRTGCVATAMAQIMNYWEWPVKGTSSHSYYWIGGKDFCSSEFFNHTYAWDKMTDSYSDGSFLDEKNAVAQLMFDCGVAVDMDYGLTASGAYDDKVASALTTYFGYTTNLSSKHQSDYATKEEWNNILTNELDFSRPVYYSADDATPNDEDGHAFVLDGYGTINNETYFHINWGWDGYDGFGYQDTDISNDGYFAMNAFNTEYHNTGEIDYYNLNSMAIVNIYPADKDEITFNNLPQMWEDGENEGNWDDNDNWNTSAVDFGIGAWKDNVAISTTTGSMSLTRQQHNTYKDIYRITVCDWDEKTAAADDDEDDNVSMFNDNANKNLIFYWNSATNDCYLPSQYTNLAVSSPDKGVRDLFYVFKGVIGKYDPTNEQFSFTVNVYQMRKPEGDESSYDIPWNNDPEGLFLALMALENGEIVYNDKKYQCSIRNTSEYAISYNIPMYNKKQYRDVNLVCDLSIAPNSIATLTLNHPEHKGLYLGNFTEDTDEQTGEYTGTAKQEAGIIKSVSAYYRIGLMPVNENTTNAGTFSFAKSLTGEVYSTTKGTLDDLITLNIPEEGAYYVVAAYYDNTQGTNFISYEYLPVFYSRSDKWDLVGDECTYYDDIVYGALYTTNNTEDVQELSVEVQQYKGGDLIKNTGDRIFRIKNPYGDYDAEYDGGSDYETPEDGIKNINGDGTHRSDVYLYLYVDADNNVSLFPDYFESQPLGLDWGRGEMMTKQNNLGEYNENIITYNTECALDLIEYFDNESPVKSANYDPQMFELQLPQNAKYYLTLVDNQPYTVESVSTDYYKGAYYSRELGINNDWGTLMLPFEFNTNKIEGFEFYKLTSATTELLTFSKYDGENVLVEANTPIVFKRTVPTKSLEVFEENNSGCLTISSCNGIKGGEAVDDWTFVGVYYNSTDAGNEGNAITEESTDPSLAQCYFFEGNEIWNVTERMDLYQYRGYFRYGGTSDLAKRIPVRFNDEAYTSLDALFNGEQPVKKYGKGRFNLQGQAVGKDYKGVVIEDGRKKISY